MKYKAVISFAGLVSMYAGEVKELTDEESVNLLSCGYIEPVEKIKTDEKRVEVLEASEISTEPAKEVIEEVKAEPKKTPTKNSKK